MHPVRVTSLADVGELACLRRSFKPLVNFDNDFGYRENRGGLYAKAPRYRRNGRTDSDVNGNVPFFSGAAHVSVFCFGLERNVRSVTKAVAARGSPGSDRPVPCWIAWFFRTE